MNYHCQCNIQRFAKAKCDFLIVVPTYKTYPSGYKGQNESKINDSEMRFCGNGLEWCPHQKIVSHENEEQNGQSTQQATER
jgi:hypothetical protein